MPPNLKEKTEDKRIYKEFEDFIIERDHPCIMAQSVFAASHLDFRVYADFGSPETAVKMLQDIKQYLQEYEESSDMVYTFLAVFTGEPKLSEEDFEQLLWQQLQQIHEADEQPWDQEVSADPEAPDFSFSIAGKAFYVVGMHPKSSRLARRSPYPAIAFNLHHQFENLRTKGRYEQVKERIRERDIALQGEINPMLRDFGDASEASQYSGRKVGEDWKCPFLHKKIKHVPADEISED